MGRGQDLPDDIEDSIVIDGSVLGRVRSSSVIQ